MKNLVIFSHLIINWTPSLNSLSVVKNTENVLLVPRANFPLLRSKIIKFPKVCRTTAASMRTVWVNVSSTCQNEVSCKCCKTIYCRLDMKCNFLN